jgi:SAM-dependent methyltransferase
MPSLEENMARVAAYYAARAPEYHETTGYGLERVDTGYARLKDLYRAAFQGRDVLEIACGTGYWTEAIATTARTVVATDIHPDLVDATRKRLEPYPHARCQVADAYMLDTVAGSFSGAFAQYWWSHIPRKMRRPFLDVLHSKLRPGARVMFADNAEYQASWVQRRVDEHGDIYEERTLRDGSRFETIKNFVSESEFKELLADVADDITYVEHDTGNGAHEPSHLWTLSYQLKG